jgi:hypothetical protein
MLSKSVLTLIDHGVLEVIRVTSVRPEWVYTAHAKSGTDGWSAVTGDTPSLSIFPSGRAWNQWPSGCSSLLHCIPITLVLRSVPCISTNLPLGHVPLQYEGPDFLVVRRLEAREESEFNGRRFADIHFTGRGSNFLLLI